ncbi:MAG: efflux RND transporter permease subunit, partial [Solirubrobacteraceae bacterium]
MKNISAWAIRHPVLPMVLFAVLLFAGMVAFIRLPITLNPPIAFPIVNVDISQPGAAPEEVETQIVRRIEAAVAGIDDIDHIYSTATQGDADITVQFRIGTPIDRAVADVRNAVTQVQVDLPPDIMPPIVQQARVDGGPIVYYDVSAPGMTPQAVSWFIDNTIT